MRGGRRRARRRRPARRRRLRFSNGAPCTPRRRAEKQDALQRHNDQHSTLERDKGTGTGRRGHATYHVTTHLMDHQTPEEQPCY